MLVVAFEMSIAVKVSNRIRSEQPHDHVVLTQRCILDWHNSVLRSQEISIFHSSFKFLWHTDASRGLIKIRVSGREANDGQSQAGASNRVSAPQQYQALAPVSRSTGDAAQRAPNMDAPVLVTFWLTFQAEFGQRICIVGNCPGLGNWQHKAAPEMQWSDGHKWNVTVEVPNSHVVEYKYVVLQPDGVTALQWQQGNNAVLAILVRLPP